VNRPDLSNPAGPGFEWFVAWRHLRDPERRTRRVLVAGLIIIALALACVTAAHFLGHRMRTQDGLLSYRPSLFTENLRLAGIAGLILGAVTTYLGLLLASFTVFTAISIFGVFLGTALPIVTLSVMSGFEMDLKTKIRGAKADVVVAVADDRPFTGWEDARRKIAAVPGVVASTPYIEAEVMMQAGQTTAAVLLRGIDPATAATVLDLGRTLREGKVDDLAHPDRVADMPAPRLGGGFGEIERKPDERKPGEKRPVLATILPGDELYRTLHVFMGNEVAVICPICNLGPTGPIPDEKTFRVAGHFYSGMYEFDSKLAYISLEAAQKFLRMPGEVTGIDVRTARPEDAPRVAEAVQAALGPGYEVRSWEELNKGLFMALRLEKIAMFVVLTFIALVASFSIISTLIMSVTQKARQVAILKSMGAADHAIRRIFFAEGLYIGLLGLSVGVASGVLACKLIMRYGLPLPTDVYYISQLPVVMRTGEISSIAALALLLCCLATLYPALLASRLRPVDGLRYE
jgi:lipoprotein-releasing system permease protein